MVFLWQEFFGFKCSGKRAGGQHLDTFLAAKSRLILSNEAG
jgi:hypothetical protein